MPPEVDLIASGLFSLALIAGVVWSAWDTWRRCREQETPEEPTFDDLPQLMRVTLVPVVTEHPVSGGTRYVIGDSPVGPPISTVEPFDIQDGAS
jgi:hypothetical protein